MEYGVPKLYAMMWEETLEEDYDESVESFRACELENITTYPHQIRPQAVPMLTLNP
jgi:hypothetical protein